MLNSRPEELDAPTTSRIAVGASLVVIAVAVLVLAGWSSGVETLKSVVGSVTMKANMAVGLLACGLALLGILKGPSTLRPVARALAVLAGAIGGLTLTEHLFGWNLGIDELLFREAPGAAATTSPGRLGLNGSLSLLLASAALLSLDQGTDRAVLRAQYIAGLLALVATVAIVGYWYGAHELYAIARYTGIAFPTAVAFLALGIGIMLARADTGPVAAFTAKGPGSAMAKQMLLPVVVVPLILGYFDVLGQRAGAVDTGLGTALLAIALVSVLIALVARTALIVNAADTHRQRVAKALQTSERNFTAMFRSLPVAVSVARMADVVIVDVNEAYTGLTNFTRDDVIGKTNADLGINRDEAGRQRILDAVRQHGIVRHADVRMITKNGEAKDTIINLNTIELDGAPHILASIEDITDRKRTETALRSRMEFDEAVMSNMGEGLYTVDADGRVTHMNPAAEKLFGWTLDELRGRKMHDATHYMHPDGSPFPAEQCAGFQVLRRGQTLVGHEDTFIRKDGSFFDVVYSSAPLREFGLVVGLVVVFSDVTDRKQIERALRDSEQRYKHAAEVAESANRIKDQFLATLSHELRTPLNAILGYTRMLRTGALAEEKRPHAIEIIERNAAVQSQLVEDLLDISRMTTGRLRLEMQMVPAIGPLQEAIDGIKPTAEAKGIRLQTEIDPFAGAVYGDPGRLQQVFWNLLSNAVKFTEPGGRVEVTLASDADSVRATVRDSGIGISPAFLPYIFDAFRQADPGFSREHGGLGLGLAICKQVVDLHAGSLTAASDGPGRGTIFTLKLKKQPTLAPPLNDHATRESPAGDDE